MSGRTVCVRVFLLTAVFLGSLPFEATRDLAQSTMPDVSPKTARARVRQIVEEILKQGEGSVQGTHTYTRVPPSPAALRELRGLGPEAVSALAEYASSGSQRCQALAVELLGRIGGADIIPALDQVLQKSPSPSLREMAVRWLPAEESESVRKILIRTAKSDSDAQVRAAADRRLAEYATK